MQHSQLIEYLSLFITDAKREKLQSMAALRMRHITVVLEELYHAQNISACLRTADCFGVQDVHVVDQAQPFSVYASIAKGAAQWLSLSQHSSIQSCYSKLRADGYTIVATTFNPDARNIDLLPCNEKLALVFSTEQHGLSADAIATADAYVAIPMFGFTQSLNVSVAVGVCLFSTTNRLRNSDVDWKLTVQEQEELIAQWICRSLPYSDKLLTSFIQNMPQ